jgi:membrane protein
MLVFGLLVLGPHLERWLGDALEAQDVTSWLWWTVQWPILVAFLLLAFAIVLYLAPNVGDKRWQIVTPGAVVALLIWLVASAGLAVYSSQFGSYEKTWGTLSAVVVTMLWLWLGAVALLFGAELNSEVRATQDAGDGGV